MDIYTIYPLIVPASYFDYPTWNLPHVQFPNKDFILTWVFFHTEYSMTYMKQEEFEQLNRDYPNWQQQAFENLRYSTDHFFTDFRFNEETKRPSFILFSNNDGIGSSRILLSYELARGFPEGYDIAMPDRAFGIALSKSISSGELSVLKGIIDEYYGCTGTAMSKEIFPSRDFSLSDDWTGPIDAILSDWMINEIVTCNE